MRFVANSLETFWILFAFFSRVENAFTIFEFHLFFIATPNVLLPLAPLRNTIKRFFLGFCILARLMVKIPLSRIFLNDFIASICKRWNDFFIFSCNLLFMVLTFSRVNSVFVASLQSINGWFWDLRRPILFTTGKSCGIKVSTVFCLIEKWICFLRLDNNLVDVLYNNIPTKKRGKTEHSKFDWQFVESEKEENNFIISFLLFSVKEKTKRVVLFLFENYCAERMRIMLLLIVNNSNLWLL